MKLARAQEPDVAHTVLALDLAQAAFMARRQDLADLESAWAAAVTRARRTGAPGLDPTIAAAGAVHLATLRGLMEWKRADL